MKLSEFVTGRKIAFFCIVIITILFLPALIFGVRQADDILFHATWFESYETAVQAGTFYPRWLPDQMGGMGSPALFFYPPFTSAFFTLVDTLLLHGLSHDRVMALSAWLMSLLAGLGFFFWARQVSGRGVAALAATCYAVAPYHLLYDYYMRAAFAEYAAYIWLPLLFAGIRLSVQSRLARWPLLLALSVAALLCTHLLTAMIVAPVAAAYSLLLIGQMPGDKSLRGGKLAVLTGAAILGAGCAALYFIPAVSLLKHANTPALFLVPINTTFFYNAFRPSEHFLLKLAIIATLYLALAIYLVCESRLALRAVGARGAAGIAREPLFWGVVIVIFYLLMCGVGKGIFAEGSPYHSIQYPWRLMGSVEFAVCSLFVVVMTHGRRRIGIVFLVAFLASLPLQLKGMHYIFHAESVADNPLPHSDNFRMRLSPPEYFPAGSQFPNTREDMVARLKPYQAWPQAVKVLAGSGEISAVQRQGANFSFSTRSSTPLSVAVGQFYFPGWAALDEAGHSLTVAPAGADKVLSVEVPAGEHAIRVFRVETPNEVAGKAVSLASVLLLALFIFLLSRRRRPVAVK